MKSGVTHNTLGFTTFLMIGTLIAETAIIQTVIMQGQVEPATAQLLRDLSLLSVVVVGIIQLAVFVMWVIFQLVVLRQNRELEAMRIELEQQRQMMQSVHWGAGHSSFRPYPSLREPLQRKHYDGY